MAARLTPPVASTPTPPAQGRRFANNREFVDALGGIPLERIVFNPWPGTATEQDCLQYGERHKPTEMIDHTLVEKDTGFREGNVAAKLISHMRPYARQHNLGLVNGADAQMRVAGGNIRLPDVTFTRNARLPIRDEPVPTLSPDLIVEVLSESNTPAEIDRRRRTVAIHRHEVGPAAVLTDTDALDGEDVLPGFTVTLADLLAGIPTDAAGSDRDS
jgi:Uma2 family endonuclease